MPRTTGLSGWRRREAMRESAARREARYPLTAECRAEVDYWRAADPEAAFVYFLQEEGHDQFVKIGLALDPVQRIRSLQTGNPRRLVADVVLYSHYFGEQAVHSLWPAQCVRGEWFETGPILGWARWAAGKQRQQHEETDDLLAATRLADKMPSLWERERAA